MASDELSSHGRLGFPRQDDAAQEAFDDPQTQPALHPVWPVLGACAPAEVPSQTCNAALYARTPAIAPSPNALPLRVAHQLPITRMYSVSSCSIL